MNKKFNLKQRSFRFRRFERKHYSAFNSMPKSVTIGVLSLALVSLTNVSKTMAQSTDSVNENKITQHKLEQVEVTDSAIAVPINQTARIVTTITKQEIDAVQ